MSEFKNKVTQASKKKLLADQDVINELLNELPSNDRQALLRFYVDGQPHDEIESALGLEADRFRDLRQFFKGAFFTRTGRGC